MTRPVFTFARLAFALLLGGPAAWAPASAQASAPVPAAEPARPALQLPDLSQMTLPLSRQVRAANSLLGLSRQRLALVVGNGQVAPGLVLPAASRDAQAVAAALRAGGFVVMVREDPGADELRSTLKEFSQRLQPGGTGFVYFTGFGAQIDGRNVLLPRGLRLQGADAPAQLRAAALPLQDLVDAVQGTAQSPRYLVVDAAYAHPALPGAGLATQEVHAGTLALFSVPPGAVLPPPEAPPALATPAPTDPRRLAATAFGRELVRSLVTPLLTGADMLRVTRGAVLDVTLGRQEPVLIGDTRDPDEFGEPNLLDAFLPTSPEDLAREALARARHWARGGERGTGPRPQPAPADGRAPGASDAPTAGSTAGAVAATAGAGAAAALGAAGGAAAATAATAAPVAAVAAAAGAAGAVGRLGSLVGGAVALASAAASDGAPSSPGVLASDAAAVTTASLSPAPTASPVAPAVAMPRPAAAAPAPDQRTQAARGGGERPAWVARSNAYGHAEGDTYMYRTIDTWKDEVVGSLLLSIESVLDDGELLADDQRTQLDAQGRPKRITHASGGSSEFVPAQEWWWADPKRGESRPVNFVERFSRADRSRGQTEWKGEMRVGRLRKIDLPAGEFEVLPIEGSGWYYERIGNGPLVSGQWSRTVWFSPKLQQPVAIDIEEANAIGKLLRRERVELMHAQTSRGGD